MIRYASGGYDGKAESQYPGFRLNTITDDGADGWRELHRQIASTEQRRKRRLEREARELTESSRQQRQRETLTELCISQVVSAGDPADDDCLLPTLRLIDDMRPRGGDWVDPLAVLADTSSPPDCDDPEALAAWFAAGNDEQRVVDYGEWHFDRDGAGIRQGALRARPIGTHHADTRLPSFAGDDWQAPTEALPFGLEGQGREVVRRLLPYRETGVRFESDELRPLQSPLVHIGKPRLTDALQRFMASAQLAAAYRAAEFAGVSQ